MAEGVHPPTPPPGDILDRIDRGLAKVEGGALILTMVLMVGLSVLQLFLRKFFDFGFEWADVMVRQMVLWIAFIGGALATQQGRHIAIDAVNKLLPQKKAAALRALTFTIAAGITGVMVNAAWVYLQDEIESEATIIGDIPAWPLRAVVPVVLVLITFHFLVGARNQVLVALGKRQPVIEVSDMDEEIV